MSKNITLDDLALMVKKGFDGVDQRFDDTNKNFNKQLSDFRSENKREHKEIKLRLSSLEYITSEMVRRDEFLELKQEVFLLKKKLKMS